MNHILNFAGFEYMDDDAVSEINRNLSALVGTTAGSCAGDRSYGISPSYLDYPIPIAQNMLALEVMEKIEMYEPRATVLSVTCKADLNGHLKATITIGPNTSYDPSDDYEEEFDDYDDYELEDDTVGEFDIDEEDEADEDEEDDEDEDEDE